MMMMINLKFLLLVIL